MLRLAVLVSGGGTNLQAILDGIDKGTITNAKVSVVVSNNKNAYALTRAQKAGIPAVCVSPKDYENREAFNRALLETIQSHQPDLVVLAGCLVVIPPEMVEAYPNRIINIHPATVHFVDAGTDTGPIILQKAVEILPGDTPEVLQRRVMEQAEWVIMPKAIDLIANGRVSVAEGLVQIKE